MIDLKHELDALDYDDIVDIVKEILYISNNGNPSEKYIGCIYNDTDIHEKLIFKRLNLNINKYQLVALSDTISVCYIDKKDLLYCNNYIKYNYSKGKAEKHLLMHISDTNDMYYTFRIVENIIDNLIDYELDSTSSEYLKNIVDLIIAEFRIINKLIIPTENTIDDLTRIGRYLGHAGGYYIDYLYRLIGTSYCMFDEDTRQEYLRTVKEILSKIFSYVLDFEKTLKLDNGEYYIEPKYEKLILDIYGKWISIKEREND